MIHMLKRYVFFCILVILFAALSASIQGQDGKTLVATVAKAMGAENLRTIQFTGSGSNAGIGQNQNPTAAWPVVRVKSYTRQLDLQGLASNVQAVRFQNNVE